MNGQYRFGRAELLVWAQARGMAVSPELLGAPEAPLQGLVASLEAGGVHAGVKAADKASALREVVNLPKLPKSLDRGFLLNILLAREALGSTSVVDGIAIPHVRNPIVPQVDRPSITLCFLESPIDFGALDGRHVRVLFTMICPTVQAHLHLHSRLGMALRDEGVKAALARTAPAAEILGEFRRVRGGRERGSTRVPGCPPHPLTILNGLLWLLGRRLRMTLVLGGIGILLVSGVLSLFTRRESLIGSFARPQQ